MTTRTAAFSESIPTWLVILLAAAWILPGLVGHDPWKPDEAYSFGLVYHILQTGDLVVPTLAGEPFMEKPPLFYLTAALFAKIFSGVLPLHDGARLASGFYIALTLLFTGLAARELYGQGRAAVLALLASLGLAPWAHLLITDTALLAGLALGLYGFALGMRSHIVGGLCLGTGIGIAFLSKGLLGPGLLGITALLLPLLHPTWRSRNYLMSLFAAGLAALPWLLLWPIALYLRSPELFSAWLWDNNFGRFLGTSGLGPKQETLFYLRTLPWFTWPTWLLALWGMWIAGRQSLQQPANLLPVVLLAVIIAALVSASDARQVYALPVMLPLALCAASALPVVPRKLTVTLFGLSVAAMFLALLFVWGTWWSSGTWLPPGFAGTDPTATPMPRLVSIEGAIAILYSISGISLIYAIRRMRERVLAGWTLVVTLFLGLSMTLLLGTIDDQKSYRAVMNSLKTAMPAASCVANEGLGEPQRAMLEYYAGVRTLLQGHPLATQCDLLLIQENIAEPKQIDPAIWRMVWEGGRMGGDTQRLRLFRRATAT